MNCCDDFGNCRQGRDCPVRKQMTDERMERLEKSYVSWISDAGLGMLVMIACAGATGTALYFCAKWLVARFAQ